MAKQEHWFVRARRYMSVVGLTVNGILHKAAPIRECPKCGEVWTDGLCPNNGCDSTAGWRQTNCQTPGCESISAVVFRSTRDRMEFFILCERCGKFKLVQGMPPKPERKKAVKKAAQESRSISIDENEPPAIGSLEKPAF